MLEKYENFLNSDYELCFGDIPMKLNGSYKFEKINDNLIYFKISINTGYNLIKKELCDSKNKIKNELQSFVESYFTNIEKYELDDLYPNYGFKSHKGYPTKKHIEAINKYGLIPGYRKTYGPVKEILNGNQNN